MVLCLPTNLDQPKSSASIQGGVGEHFEEVGLTHVVRTGAANQDTAGAEHLQGAEVEFFVATESRVEIALALGEGGGVENDGVVAAGSRRVIFGAGVGRGLYS